MNKKYLPSKKFIRVTLSILVGIFIIYMVILYRKTYVTLKNPEITTTTVKVQELLEKDTDSDGIKDWEEVLWGTDVNKVATFGMADKQYIDNKRLEISTATGTEAENIEKLNDTERIAREFLTTILTLKESGNLNSFNITNLAEKFSKDIGATAELRTTYTGSDIRPATDTAASKKAYYTAFSKAIAAAKKNGMGAEIKVIANYFSDEESDATELTKLSTTYATLTKSLKSMDVPSSAVALHLELLNESDNMAAIFKNISQIDDDSIVGLVAIAQFELNEPKMEKTLTDFIAYFKSNGIIK
jgi:hypothetical protein